MRFVVKGDEYDLSDFDHPGGTDIFHTLGSHGIKDMTPLFYVYHSNPEIILHTILPKHRIGPASSIDTPQYDYTLYLELKKQVLDFIDQNNLSFGYSTEEWLSHSVFAVVYVATLLSYLSRPSWWATFVLAGMFSWSANLAHEASHRVNWRKDQKPMHFLFENVACFYTDMYQWFNDHVYLHHSFTNTYLDPDAAGVPFLLRVLPIFPRLHHHRYQHMYLIPLTLVTTFLKGILPSLTKRLNVASALSFTTFLWCSREFPFHFLTLFGLPGLFIAIALLNHVQEDHVLQEWNEDFLKHQLATTSNYTTNSLTRLFTLNLDIQIEHHLFPNVAHTTLRKVKPVVRRFCKEHDIPYIEKQGVWSSFRGMIDTLIRMGQP